MALPLHVGTEHPNLLWVLLTGVLAFAAGMAVHLVRSPDAPDASSTTADDPTG